MALKDWKLIVAGAAASVVLAAVGAAETPRCVSHAAPGSNSPTSETVCVDQTAVDRPPRSVAQMSSDASWRASDGPPGRRR